MKTDHQNLTPRKKILHIIEDEAKKHDISLDQILGSSRAREITAVRNKCYWLIREKFGISLLKIGKIFNRNHTTVLRGILAYEYAEGTIREENRQKYIKWYNNSKGRRGRKEDER